MEGFVKGLWDISEIGFVLTKKEIDSEWEKDNRIKAS